jgi:hypothetical protein
MMPAVHEQMHERTSRQQQPGQHAKDVRGVLREQEEPCHNKETAGNDPERGPPPRLFLMFIVHGLPPFHVAAGQRGTRRSKKLYRHPKTSAMYQPQTKLSAIPRQKLRQLNSSNPGKKMESAVCSIGRLGNTR